MASPSGDASDTPQSGCLTVAATDPVARAADQLEYQLGTGPRIDAVIANARAGPASERPRNLA